RRRRLHAGRLLAGRQAQPRLVGAGRRGRRGGGRGGGGRRLEGGVAARRGRAGRLGSARGGVTRQPGGVRGEGRGHLEVLECAGRHLLAQDGPEAQLGGLADELQRPVAV